MLLIDVLALVAEEELASLREEEQRKKKMQYRAEPVRDRKLQRTERRKLVMSSSDDDDDDGDNVVAAPVIPTEPKPESILSCLKFKVKIGKDFDDKGASKKKKGKTEVNNGKGPVCPRDLPTKFINKKRKRREFDNGANLSRDMPSTSKKPDNGPDPPPDLPSKFKNMILEKARGEPVEEAVLVIQKGLTTTDIRSHQNRISIPLNQTRNRFLNEEDERWIRGRDAKGNCNALNVDIIEPKGVVRSVNMTRWVMGKLSGQPSICYVLNGEGWKKIKSCNHLQVGNVVQLWAVQILGKTCLVLVKLY